MPTIIKATDRNRGVHPVAFNLDDMARHAESYREKLRAEAAKIIADAMRQAEQIRQQAEQEGRRTGEQAVEQMVRAQVSAQMQTLLPALQRAVTQIEESKQAWLSHWERRAVKLAAAMAARITRRQVAQEPQVTLELLRESLQLVAGSARVRVLLHPDDLSALGGAAEELVAQFSGLAEAQLLGDANITRGGCRVETQHGALDQQFERQLERIEQELT